MMAALMPWFAACLLTIAGIQRVLFGAAWEKRPADATLEDWGELLFGVLLVVIAHWIWTGYCG